MRDPERNIPRSTVLGTLGSAVVYLLSLTAVFGILPTVELAQDTNRRPYSRAANTIVGGTWAGNLMALAVVVSGFGALNGWTMICAEMPLAAAKEGFPASRSGGSPGAGCRPSASSRPRARLGGDGDQLPRPAGPPCSPRWC